MGTGFAKKKKQSKMLQEQLTKMQSEMKKSEVIGAASNDLVTITLTGDYEIKQIKIKPECVDPEDVEGLEDLIKMAYRDAFKKLQQSSMKGMPSFPGMQGAENGLLGL